MTAKDDFQIIKQALETLNNLVPVKQNEPDALAAFNRMFTPRPLRELVADGYRAFMFVPSGNIAKLMNDLESLSFIGHSGYIALGRFAEDFAIPILTPDDMGVEV